MEKKCGALLFSLNFLWLLSLFQDKESDKSAEDFLGLVRLIIACLYKQLQQSKSATRLRSATGGQAQQLCSIAIPNDAVSDPPSLRFGRAGTTAFLRHRILDVQECDATEA
jgi:hypothetical protein